MADGQHSRSDGGVPAAGRETARRASLEVSRRTLLGAVCATALIPRHPGLDPGSMNTVGGETDAAVSMDPGLRRDDGEGRDDEWSKALARFHSAQTTLDAAVHEPDQDAYDALLGSHSEALAALLRSPAPDLPALAAKLDVIVPQLAWELTGSEDCLERLRQDAHRLAATAA